MLLLGEKRGREGGRWEPSVTARQAERGGEKCSSDIPRLGNTAEGDRLREEG